MVKNIAVGVLAAAVLVLGALVAQKVQVIEVKVPFLGASSGPEHSFQQVFNAGFVNGGPSVTLTVGAASTSISAQQVCESGFVQYSPLNTVPDLLYVPSSTKLFGACLDKVGKSKTLFFQNASSGGFATLYADDTSSTIKVLAVASTSLPTVGTSTLANGDVFKVTFLRITSSTQSWLNILVESLKVLQ